MTIGVTMPARLALRLKMPPVRPIERLRRDVGDDGPSEVGHALPEERDAQDRDDERVAPMRERSWPRRSSTARNIPLTIGSLRARLADPVRVSRKSDRNPPHSTPTDAAM